jgi:hypothetical protein
MYFVPADAGATNKAKSTEMTIICLLIEYIFYLSMMNVEKVLDVVADRLIV